MQILLKQFHQTIMTKCKSKTDIQKPFIKATCAVLQLHAVVVVVGMVVVVVVITLGVK